MKTIEERANEFVGESPNPNEHLVISLQRRAFCNGARSEHEELTRWNSPECPPDGLHEVLAKICGGYYKVVEFDSNVNLYKVSGTQQHIEIFGWREIHE